MTNADTRIGDRYEVVRPLGSGSFGETLLARDLVDDRLVAIKALHSRKIENWKAYELFEREAATLRALRHHGVPVVYESFRANWNGGETSFLVLEYVEGASLATIISDRRHLSTSDALHLFDEMLGVLDYLHTRVPPVLHRDIKPGNIIVRPDGSPVLVDFGTVRNVFRDADDSGSTVAGTYGYMPYEQLMGQASPASDLYALAATFLHLLTGRAPPEFLGDSGRLEVPASLPGGPAFAAVLGRMLAPVPSERFRSARDVRSALLGDGTESRTRVVPAVRELALPPSPRQLTGDILELYKRTAPSMWDLMQASEKPGTRWGFADIALTGLFSVLTAGVLPAVFYSIAATRRRRLKEFLLNGEPATARVLQMTTESVAFEVKLMRVRYEFEVDGKLFRDSDQIMPSIADRWDVGSPISILYMPDRAYDSVIVSTS